jgi:GLPGLI family protein
MRITALVLIFFLFLLSCDTIDFTDQPQGIIEYEVTYLSNKSTTPTNLLPKKIVLKFRAQKSITTITGFMNMFALSNVSDFRKNTNTMLLKVFDKKYFYEGEKFDPPFFFDKLKNPIIKLEPSTKVIAGITCKKANISFADTTLTAFELYYTDSIKLKSPNKSTPLNQIDGVLMQFNIYISNVEMQLTAIKYKPDNVSADVFNLPDDYKKLKREQFIVVVNKLLD